MKTDIYDIAVIGAGPAGSMAAIRAGQLKKKVILIERNDCLGKKLLLTGKGRCNITNTASVDDFIEKFQGNGQFLRSAFHIFFNEDMMDFFRSNGLELKAERQGRVFPATDRASSVTEALKNCLEDCKVEVAYNKRLTGIKKEGGCLRLEIDTGGNILAKKAILATGGASYTITGSTGDGYRIAENLGHKIVPLKPALVPLKTKENWAKDLQGLSLENIRIVFECGKKKIMSEIGEFIFTHFGVSGPLILDLSGEVILAMEKNKEMSLFIDLKPGLSTEQLEKRLLREFEANGKMRIKNLMKELLPQRLIPVFLRISAIDPEKSANNITQKERRLMIKLLKNLPLTIAGALPLEQAMVTSGGVSTAEINPRTMESRIVPGLYFAGEMIDGCASSGGYNLQKAFSTGYLAGDSAANA